LWGNYHISILSIIFTSVLTVHVLLQESPSPSESLPTEWTWGLPTFIIYPRSVEMHLFSFIKSMNPLQTSKYQQRHNLSEEWNSLKPNFHKIIRFLTSFIHRNWTVFAMWSRSFDKNREFPQPYDPASRITHLCDPESSSGSNAKKIFIRSAILLQTSK